MQWTLIIDFSTNESFVKIKNNIKNNYKNKIK